MRCVSPKQIRALLCDKKNEALGTDELGKQMRNNRDVEQLHALDGVRPRWRPTNERSGQLGDVERSQAYSRVFIMTMTRRACKANA
jgi:hypothetical protein